MYLPRISHASFHINRILTQGERRLRLWIKLWEIKHWIWIRHCFNKDKYICLDNSVSTVQSSNNLALRLRPSTAPVSCVYFAGVLRLLYVRLAPNECRVYIKTGSIIEYENFEYLNFIYYTILLVCCRLQRYPTTYGQIYLLSHFDKDWSKWQYSTKANNYCGFHKPMMK